MDLLTCDQTHEIVAALHVAARPHANCTDGPIGHAIVVIFVCLNIRAKLLANMFVVQNILSCHDVVRQEYRRHAIGCWKSIQPENSIPSKIAQ